jgi:hypothetical protein
MVTRIPKCKVMECKSQKQGENEVIPEIFIRLLITYFGEKLDTHQPKFFFGILTIKFLIGD